MLHEVARGDHFGRPPELRELAQVAGNQIIGARGLRAFSLNSLSSGSAAIVRDRDGATRRAEFWMGRTALRRSCRGILKKPPRQDLLVFGEDSSGGVKTGWFRECNQHTVFCRSRRLSAARDNDIRVEDQAERNHLRLRLRSRGILDDLVDLPRGQLVGAVSLRPISEN